VIDVVVFVLAGGSSSVVVFVTRVFFLVACAVAVVVIIVVDVVVCKLEMGKGGSVRYIKKYRKYHQNTIPLSHLRAPLISSSSSREQA
jgi:hypothetical protein